jgi:putative transposase
MKRAQCTFEQVIAVLKQHHAAMSAADLCRKRGIAGATLYVWRKTYGSGEHEADET